MKTQQAIAALFARIAPVYDLLNHLLSLGLHKRWRQMAAATLNMPAGAKVVDVAAGTGDMALAVAQAWEGVDVVGVDLVRQMLTRARAKARAEGVGLKVVVGDATALPLAEGSFQALTIAFGIRNIPERTKAWAEFYRVLAPGGRVCVVEFGMPTTRVWRAIYGAYLGWILPVIGGVISGEPGSYRYLAKSVMAFASPQQLRAEMKAAGFVGVRSYPLSGGITWVHLGSKPISPPRD